MGGWVGGLSKVGRKVDGWVEEKKAVGMSCCGKGGGWVTWRESFLAFHLYFLLSLTSLEEADCKLSSFSPLLRTSWMFFFMIEEMSARSSVSLEVFLRELGSRYSRRLLWMVLSVWVEEKSELGWCMLWVGGWDVPNLIKA